MVSRVYCCWLALRIVVVWLCIIVVGWPSVIVVCWSCVMLLVVLVKFLLVGRVYYCWLAVCNSC